VRAWGGSITALDAGFTKMDMVVARSWSAAGTGGGTATISGNNQNLRTSMGATLLGEARTATTAALGTGTKTLDAQPIGNAGGSVANVAGAVVLPHATLFDALGGALHPLVLVQNEGFVIRATVPATGTWTGGFDVVWAEVTSY
jgi:hypothetical protein